MNQKSIKIRNKLALPVFGASMLFLIGFGFKNQVDTNKVKKNLEDYTVQRKIKFKIDYPRMMKLKEIVESSVNTYLSKGNIQGAYSVLDLLLYNNDWQKYIKMAEITYNGPLIPTVNDLTPIDLVNVLEAYFKDYYKEISKF